MFSAVHRVTFPFFCFVSSTSVTWWPKCLNSTRRMNDPLGGQWAGALAPPHCWLWICPVADFRKSVGMYRLENCLSNAARTWKGERGKDRLFFCEQRCKNGGGKSYSQRRTGLLREQRPPFRKSSCQVDHTSRGLLVLQLSISLMK